MEQDELIPHLFRTEAGRIASVLCRHFGLSQIEVAEDITADTFLAALESWSYSQISANPVAWLYSVAKNKTRNYQARERLFHSKVAAQVATLTYEDQPEPDLAVTNIRDSQLQMLFALTDPQLPAETQVCLALKIICGFGVEEIAHAFMMSTDAISKRLTRGKQACRERNLPVQMPVDIEIPVRLPNVLSTLYLLFSEGWYSETNEQSIREDLCFEAMRMTRLLLDNPATNQPAVNALYALMCFQASRLAARQHSDGSMLLYEQQDENDWDQVLISEGARHLQLGASGSALSSYHLEAMIAFYHTNKILREASWEEILQLYNRLLQLHYTPAAALNRTNALYRANGYEAAIIEAEKRKLANNPYYFTLLAELYKNTDPAKSLHYLLEAAATAKTIADKTIIQQQIEFIQALINMRNSSATDLFAESVSP